MDAAAITFERVDWLDPRAVALRAAMDAESSLNYAELMRAQSAETNAAIAASFAVDGAAFVDCILAIDETGTAVGHAALRPWNDELEVKKVFVTPQARGRGISRELMTELERLAAARGIRSLVLQTGVLQLAAIGLYESMGYRPIDVYGAYTVVPFAVCYRKGATRVAG